MKYKLTLFSLAFFVLLISLSLVHAFESDVYQIGIEIPLTDDGGDKEPPIYDDNDYTPGSRSSGGDTTYWECGKWSECINETQERVCEDIFGTKLNRTETKKCSPDFVSGQNNKTISLDENQESQTTNFLTGAVTGIGNFAKSGTGIVIFISLIGTLIIFFVIRKKRMRE